MEQVSKYTKYGLHVRRFCDSDTKLATPSFLRRQKNLLPSAVNQKDPGFGRFSLRAFEWRSGFFLNRAGYLDAPFWPT